MQGHVWVRVSFFLLSEKIGSTIPEEKLINQALLVSTDYFSGLSLSGLLGIKSRNIKTGTTILENHYTTSEEELRELRRVEAYLLQ